MPMTFYGNFTKPSTKRPNYLVFEQMINHQVLKISQPSNMIFGLYLDLVLRWFGPSSPQATGWTWSPAWPRAPQRGRSKSRVHSAWWSRASTPSPRWSNGRSWRAGNPCRTSGGAGCCTRSRPLQGGPLKQWSLREGRPDSRVTWSKW